METWLPEFIAGVFVLAIGWLLAHKDKAQQKDIEELKASCLMSATNHTEDAKDLMVMKLELAKGYHPKNEVDDKFRSFEDTMTKGFDNIRADIKQLFDERRGK